MISKSLLGHPHGLVLPPHHPASIIRGRSWEALIWSEQGMLIFILWESLKCFYLQIAGVFRFQWLPRRRLSVKTLLTLMQSYCNSWLSPICTQDLWSSPECPIGSCLLPRPLFPDYSVGLTASSRKSSGRCPSLVFTAVWPFIDIGVCLSESSWIYRTWTLWRGNILKTIKIKWKKPREEVQMSLKNCQFSENLIY